MPTTMIDSIHANAGNIPTDAPKVAGYVTGTQIIEWTTSDWARFPRSGHVRIEQGYGKFNPFGCDVFDVEYLGVPPAVAVDGVKARIAGHMAWTTIYGPDNYLAQVRAALDDAGPHGWYYGRVDCWLADWNLSEAQAAGRLGTLVHGLHCRAVQWASPSSNPTTRLPGSSLTLAQANCDLSVTEDDWHAYEPPPPHGPHKHTTKAGDTVESLAASRGMKPESWLAEQAKLGADVAALASGPLKAGITWLSVSP